MKTLTQLGIILTTAIFLQSCGALNDSCGSDIRMGCNTIFGELPKDPAPQPEVADNSCSVKEVANGAEITCGDETVLIENGNDAAPHPHSISQIINPCGKDSTFDEVLLRFFDGTLVAYFENGGKRFLTEIPEGNYMTTDTQACLFSVNSELQVQSTYNVTAKRERPSGDFVDVQLNNLVSVKLPDTLLIEQSNINPQGLWAVFVVGDVNFCYQAGNGVSLNSRTLHFKHSKVNMVGDCSANNDNIKEQDIDMPILVDSLFFRVLNSGKVGSTHVTTEVKANLIILE